MKKLFTTTLAILSAIAMTGLTSCGDTLEKGYDLSSQSIIDSKIVPEITKNIGEEAVVYNIILGTVNALSKKANTVIVTYSAPGSSEVSAMNISLGRNHARDWNVSSRYSDRTPDTGVKIKEINFSQISTFIEGAAAFLEPEGYSFDGIESYTIIAKSSNPAEIVHNFSMSSKEGTSLSASGGKIGTETSYYGFEFDGYADGQVEYQGE